jgi:aspartate racemase
MQPSAQPETTQTMKTIGLIGGMSWESSIEYYRIVNEAMKQRLGGHNNARSVMVTLNFEEIVQMQRAGEWQALGERMADAARQLERAGADMVLICTNTMHKLSEEVEAAVSIPLVHIADVTARAILAAGLKRIALLGTRFTMEQEFYRERLGRFGIDVMIPEEDDRAMVHGVIFDELCHGVANDASRREYMRVIEAMQAAGAEGVVLACTEIPLLIKQSDVSLPLFDTTELHALAAVEAALA